MSDIVIREVCKDVWTFSKPFARFNVIPFGGRSTAVKLSNGDVWVLASTPLSPETKTTLDKLGPVKYIMCADAVHTLYLREFKTSYPDAKLVGVQAMLKKDTAAGLDFAGAYGSDKGTTEFGFESEIKACYFSGFKNKDVAFLHQESKTLIEADLLFNLPAREQYSKSNSFFQIPFISAMSPFHSFQRKAVESLGEDKEAMKRDARTVAGWDFARIIPCHGDVIENNAKDAWKDVYQAFL